ncbi:aldo/keto reductase [Salinicoccus sp. ID82-1]|uniref:Aldo/keto reductase family oxidoreductase n=1 Tax=Salinicoccus cyprini TaxID=2493691 RepID=A0A558ASS1_9STAP|nr:MULTISPECIES: aldo/keto reductase [Salinicoccus]MCG1009823.1 aldo/keto reductase [Salinicoccus sp. ID82-1]TVT27310.1 aldo/keto reductase family oxidoreductase [Salinicoccus cyprini]
MDRINLGGSELEASRIVLGCMRISEMKTDALARHISTAIEHGINLFDHADIYGRGECERKFGKLLATELDRKDILIQSKCGIRHERKKDVQYYDLSKAYIIDAVDGILERLGTDYLDLLMLHRPDALMEPEEISEAFDRLHDTGKVRHFGLSNFNANQFDFVQQHTSHKLITNQVQFGPAAAHLVNSGMQANTPFEGAADRDGGLLEQSRLNDVTLQAWSPFHYGYFEGIIMDDPKFEKLNKVLEDIGQSHGITKNAAAIAWILRHPATMQTIVGTTDTSRLEDIAKAGNVRLSREEWYQIYATAGNMVP